MPIYPLTICVLRMEKHLKNDFLYSQTQKSVIDRFYKLFEMFPERLVFSKVSKDGVIDVSFTNDTKLAEVLNKASEYYEEITRM